AVITLQAASTDLALPYFTETADLPPDSPEAALRTVRYAFLARTARTWGATHVAVAHHADDQAETFLLRLLRGAVAGLRAMQPVRPLDGLAPPIRLVRPLLDCRRAALHAVCAAAGIVPVEDPSNNNERFRRNALRRSIMPSLQPLWPAAVSVLTRTAHWLGEDDAYLQALAAEAFRDLPPAPAPIQVAALLALPGPIRRRVLRAWVQARTGLALNSTQLAAGEGVLSGERTGATLARGWTLHRAGGWLTLAGSAETTEQTACPFSWQETAGTHLWPWPFVICLQPVPAALAATPFQVCLPQSWQGRELVWRGLLPGDRLASGQGRLRVAEILRQRGYHPTQRAAQLVLAEGSDVHWLVGVRCSEALRHNDGGAAAWQVSLEPSQQPHA
ncbi:MAG: tRNA lysidine(34) synthetase TilS, partial [Candidatus Sericytochromatia bacterium]|nr:tRNA lysidine(34) synthetase TilS [Candidatus Sericytochromatia bacterium]